ncbi:MAG: ankyrin repeat domain-containing protein [Desulfobulbaceae bacterium]|nr:ankyrin repeat domain-containing protein [Desulfobulbaceae bacterium]HIJ89723.1 hypothetical protein [Deltaproteobacteria bacterium]
MANFKMLLSSRLICIVMVVGTVLTLGLSSPAVAEDAPVVENEALWLGGLPASLSACGTITWMPEIGALLDYLVKERGFPSTEKIMQKTLSSLLPGLDKRLTLETLPGQRGDTLRWRARWEKQLPQDFPLDDQHPQTDLASRVHLTLAEACALMRAHEPDKKIFTDFRGVAGEFEAAFLQVMQDPAAEFGFDPISLSVQSKGNVPPSESFSAHWMDKKMGIARIYLPDLFVGRDLHFDEGLKSLQDEAPVKSLLLDLRASGGGSIDMLHSILGRFLPQETPIYEAIDQQRQGREVRLNSPTLPARVLDIPILVLVSSKTRGGAEIIAGVLQGAGHVEVYGEPTAGLASHKTIIKLGKSRAILLTHELLKFPGKSQTQDRILPDISVPADKALETALATLAVDGRLPENPFLRKDEKISPLISAILAEQQDDAVRLIEAGADLDVEASPNALDRLLPYRRVMERDGRTPLVGYPLAIAAAAVGMPKVLKAIGQRDSKHLHATDINGRTALAYAARSGFLESTRYLLSQGLDPIKRANKYPANNTPLALAVQEKQSEAVALLIAAIPKEKYTTVEVAEQVWVAAYSNDTPTLRALLAAGVSPDCIAPQGNTALMSSVQDANLAQVQLLLEHGATIDDHPYRGKNIFEYAEAKRQHGGADAEKIYSLIQNALRQDSHWQKNRQTETMEMLQRMIEHPDDSQSTGK